MLQLESAGSGRGECGLMRRSNERDTIIVDFGVAGVSFNLYS